MQTGLKGLLTSITTAVLVFAQPSARADEVTAHRSLVGQFEFGTSGFLHPNKAKLTPADQGVNPHRHQGTITITGLGDGYENLIEKCEGFRLRNFNIGAKPPNNHQDVGECTIFRGKERVGTSTYNGTPANPGRKLYLNSQVCEQTGRKLVEGKGNSFSATLAPPNKLFLGGAYRVEEIVSFVCRAK